MTSTKRHGKLFGGMLPILVWGAAVVAVVSLYVRRHHTFALTGLAISPSQTLAAADNGIVRNIPVKLFEPVRRGDLLAILELGAPPQNDYLKALAEARKKTAMAELERLEAELKAAYEQLRYDFGLDDDDRMVQYSRLAVEAESAQLDLLKTRTMLELDRGLLAGLERERDAVLELLARDAVHPFEAQKARLEYDALASKIAAAELQEQQAALNLTQARQRLARYRMTEQEETLIETLLEPHRRAVAVQERVLDELFAPMVRMMLTAQFDGVVSAIFISEGQGVQAGDMILIVSPPSAEYVLAWLDPAFVGRIEPSQPVEIAKHSYPQQVFRSEIAAISPTVELLPEQMWPTPTMPKWGRPVKISVPDGVQLAGNEIVSVRGL